MLALTVIVTFALGIGANSLVLCVVNAILLRPLPYGNPSELVAVTYSVTESTQSISEVPSPLLTSWLQRSRTFKAFSTHAIATRTIRKDTGEQIEVVATTVSPNLFETLEVEAPTIGRYFGEQDAVSSDVAVLSHALWRTQFGSDERIVGRTVRLGRSSLTVVGVTPRAFRFPNHTQPDVFVSQRLPGVPLVQYLQIIGRLSPGIARGQAERELISISQDDSKQYPTSVQSVIAAGAEPQVVPLQEHLAGNLRAVLPISIGAAMCVLLLACVNISNMLLAHAQSRRGDIRVRSALGATPTGLLRLLLAEHLLWASLGISAAMFLVWCCVEALGDILVEVLPYSGTIIVDTWTLCMTMGIGAVAAILSSIHPIIFLIGEVDTGARNRRGDVVQTQGWAARRTLVSGQVALALVLLIGSILFTQTLWRLTGADLGFNPEKVLTFRLSGIQGHYNPAERARFVTNILAEANAAPEVISAAATTSLPLDGAAFRFDITVEGEPPPAPGVAPTFVDAISPLYFNSIGARLKAGRDFNERDTSTAPRVAVVNEAFVREKIKGRDPIGLRIGFGGSPNIQIVGVVEDIQNQNPRMKSSPQVFAPLSQAAPQFMWHTALVTVRTETEPTAFIKTLQLRLASLGRKAALYNWTSLKQSLASTITPELHRALLFGLFAVLAITLASGGLYALVAFAAAQRLHELGIRAVLGARRGNLVACVLREGLLSIALGLALGLIGAAILTRLLEGLLHGVKPTDPLTYISAMCILSLVSIVASAIPALQAARADPIVTLRRMSSSSM